MFARRPVKQRFQVDAPRQRETVKLPAVSRPNLVSISTAGKPRSSQKRFRVQLNENPRRMALPFSIAQGASRLRRRATLTLAQRRQLLRMGIIAGALLVVFALIGGGLWVNPTTHNLLFPSPSQVSGSGDSAAGFGAVSVPLHQGLGAPYQGLQPYSALGAKNPPTVQAQAAFLFDPQHGWIMLKANADTPYPIASLAKVMTMLLAVDSGPLDRMVTVGPDAAALVNPNNSYMDLSAGEQVPMRDLLYGLIVAGGNDAALAIADDVGGSKSAFVAMMNSRAHQLGLTETHFVSPDGVDAGNVSSASDMAKLAALVLTRPGVKQITSTYSIVIPQTSTHKIYRLQGANDLLTGGGSPYAGADGVKTGYTDSAQYCMAFSATVNGRELVGVVLGETDPGARNADAHTMLDWAFSQQ